MSFDAHEKNGLVFLTSPLLANVRHGFSTRQGGVSRPPFDTLNLGVGRGDDPAGVAENYRRFCGALDVDPERAVLSRQVHETTVRLCAAGDAGKGLLLPRDYTADALITNEPDLPLTVFSADCGVILLYDPVRRAAGAVHAGWRGCAGGILEKAVQAMAAAFHSDPHDLLAAIGPSIGPCCFETDSDVPKAMRAALGTDAESYLTWKAPKYHVDLAGLNRQWLLRSGVTPDHIDVCGLCTACRPDLFWSHRKMGNSRGAQVAMIALSSQGERGL